MPGKSKKGGGLEVGSAYKMKYQGNHSAFPFKSPLEDKGHQPPRGEDHPIDFAHSKDDPAAQTGDSDDSGEFIIDETGNWVKKSSPTRKHGGAHHINNADGTPDHQHNKKIAGHMHEPPRSNPYPAKKA